MILRRRGARTGTVRLRAATDRQAQHVGRRIQRHLHAGLVPVGRLSIQPGTTRSGGVALQLLIHPHGVTYAVDGDGGFEAGPVERDARPHPQHPALAMQAQQAFDEEEAVKMAEKLATEQFTLEDFLDQLQQMKKMGSMKKMLGMLPGMGQMKQQLEDFDEREIDRTEAIIRSLSLIHI